MKKTVELDTINICDRLHHLSYEPRVMALACKGMEDAEDSGWVGNMIFDLAGKIHDIGDEICPSLFDPPADRQMRQISKDRRDTKIQAEMERNGT
jgi:hypothetical protein